MFPLIHATLFILCLSLLSSTVSFAGLSLPGSFEIKDCSVPGSNCNNTTTSSNNNNNNTGIGSFKEPGGVTIGECSNGDCSPAQSAIHTCSAIQVNSSNSTTQCVSGNNGCGLDAALAMANNCDVPSTITFEGVTQIDLAALSSAPLTVSGKKPITIDGGATRISLKPKAGVAAFQIDGTSNILKNLVFNGDSTMTAPISLKDTALDTDIQNISSPVRPFNNVGDQKDFKALYFVRPYVTDGVFVAYALLPKDLPSDKTAHAIRAYRTSASNTQDFIGKEAYLEVADLENPPMTTLEVSKVLDVTGAEVDAGKSIYGGILKGFVPTENVLFTVKAPGKNILLFDTNTPLLPLFKDGDGDGLTDAFENMIGTDPAKAQTDEDSCGDYAEVIDTTGIPRVKLMNGNLQWTGLAASVDGTLYANDKSYNVCSLKGQDPGQTPAPSAGSAGCNLSATPATSSVTGWALFGFVLSALFLTRSLRQAKNQTQE